MLVFLCDPGNEGTATTQSGLFGQTEPFPTCDDGGYWVDITTLVHQGLEFSLSQLDPAVISAAFGAGFIAIAFVVLLGRSVGVLLSMFG